MRVDVETMLEMTKDVVKIFDRIEDNYKTLQQHVSSKDLFRGFVARD